MFLDTNCGLQKHALERTNADLLLLLDRSSSMKSRPMGSQMSKWVETTSALQEALMRTDTAVNWGLKTFPAGSVECTVRDGVDVAVKPANAPAVWSAIVATIPEGHGTPTQAAVRKATAYLKTVATNDPKYLLLATDGYPNCRDGSDGSGDSEGAVAGVKEAAAAGFQTFVIGVATASSEHLVLNQMAEAGGKARAGDTRYYAVSSRQELVAALGEITGQITSCTFPLDKQPPSRDDVAVNVDGARVPRDATRARGWDYSASGDAVELHGPTCDQVKAKGANVEIIFGCPGVVIP